eukprot:CAMPEP_0197238790 /NCGR_PEP_ID=MMETSP1429-20130617/5300_1 /TAXON_ID=49237 /ORGANISM="Chaetoceros  sp., Strain UNC1202" /LENGTH=387 /DNA_ID=CAMNT_0042698045 /DNA_START=116 /DNA_END=1279 /DNA_ORIENTATION=-
MMFRPALLATALFASAVSAATINSDADVAADSKIGSKLLSKARRVNQNAEEDFTWMTKHSVKFDRCYSIHAFGGEGAEGGEDEEGNPFGVQHLVAFKLCPTTNKCGGCSGGAEYVVEMRDFVEAYVEAKQDEEEAACQTVENNCNCNYYDGDDNACMAKCYADAGLTNCGENQYYNGNNNNNGNGDFDVAEYMECRETEFGNYYNQFYIGPVCSSNGGSIHLKLYSDAGCSVAAKSGSYEQYNYGKALPYSKESIVSTKHCFSCKEQDDNDNNNNNNNNNNNQYYNYEAPEATEFCQELYQESAKCEKNLKYKNSGYRITSSCHYINKVLPALQKVYKKNGSGVAGVFAGLFFISTVGASAAAYYFYTKVERATIDLSAKDGTGTLA